jgi:3-oxoacyl-[acyl-carrier protein] reductase
MKSSQNAAPGCVLVTGGARGIGAAIARALAATGRPVAVGYANRVEAAEQTVAAIEQDGGSAVAVGGDLCEPKAIEGVFAQLEEQFGRVAVLVNNAGVRDDGLLLGLEDDAWDQVLATNLTAAYRVSRRALGPMLRARHGRIINITSILVNQAIPGTGNYVASKAGLSGLTRAMAVEVAHRGVTVNAVAPGLVETDLTRELGHFEASVRRAVPMRRPARLEEIAACVRFLAGDEASYVTGQTLTVDGGLGALAFSID